MVRQDTNWWNIAYVVSKCNSNADKLVELCRTSFDALRDNERIVVYVPAISLIAAVKEAFAEVMISCATYSAQQAVDENEYSFSSWREGETKIMIATSCFGYGVDYDHVRSVFCYGLPYSLEDFRQQTGQAGHDGKASSTFLVFNPRKEQYKLERMEEGPRKDTFQTMIAFGMRDSVCQRRVLSRYFDSTDVECSMQPCKLCDICHSYHEKESLGHGQLLQTSWTKNGPDVSHGRTLLSQERNLGQQLEYFSKKYQQKCIVCHLGVVL